MADIFVIVYETPNAPVGVRYNLYYRGDTSQSGPLPLQPTTNVHFIARPWPVQHRVLLGLRQNVPGDFFQESNTHFVADPWRPPTFYRAFPSSAPPPTTAAPVVETNTHFVPRMQPVTHAVLSNLRQNVASISGPLPLQPETNVHFVPSMRPVVFSVLPGLRQLPARDLFVAETPTHYIPKAWPVVHSVMPALRQNIASASGPLPPQPETNTNFLAKPWPISHNVSIALRQNAAVPPTATVETNQHFVPRMQPVGFTVLPALRQNIPSELSGPLPHQPETNTHFRPGYVPTVHLIDRRLMQAASLDLPQPETNVNFQPKYAAPVHTLDRRLLQNPALDLPPFATNVHFQPHHTPTIHTIDRRLSQQPALDVPPQPETNVHFTPRHTPAAHFVDRRLIMVPALDRPPQPETNTHFGPRFFGAPLLVDRRLMQAPARDVSSPTQPETNTNYAKPQTWPVSYALLKGLRQNVPTDPFVIPSAESGANPHFLARFTPADHHVARWLTIFSADTSFGMSPDAAIASDGAVWVALPGDK
jgi:hypothetical protein